MPSHWYTVDPLPRVISPAGEKLSGTRDREIWRQTTIVDYNGNQISIFINKFSKEDSHNENVFLLTHPLREENDILDLAFFGGNRGQKYRLHVTGSQKSFCDRV